MDDVERAFREAYGQAVATLTRLFGDITFVEDAVQDAFVTALDRWPRDGIPNNPAGWIVTTARNRAVDVVRRSRRERQLTKQIHRRPGGFNTRLIAGLTPAEVASAFLVSEETMAKL